MMKFPKKEEGLEHVHVDGSILVCRPTGKTWVRTFYTVPVEYIRTAP